MINLFTRLSTEAADPEHPAHPYFRERYASIRKGTARVLEAAAAMGYLRPDADPMDVAIQLTALMDGLQTQWGLEPGLGMHHHLRRAILGWLTPEGVNALMRVERG